MRRSAPSRNGIKRSRRPSGYSGTRSGVPGSWCWTRARDQGRAWRRGACETRLRFSELDSQGDLIGEPRELTLEGDEVYVDALVIKFDDTFVIAGDALKGKALLLFRRIFSDRRRPAEGHVLDREGPDATDLRRRAGADRVRA